MSEPPFTVLDLFSAAAGGWSLGLHRAGFRTVAACEVIDWRRALYIENNPHVRLYDDVRTLTAERLQADLGYVPDVVVGSPPCQDISLARQNAKGVDGDESRLFFEGVRIAGECKRKGGARWVALENGAGLRTRGADRVLGALEGHGYTCWPLVVRARDLRANHIRPRVWLIACDVDATIDRHEGGRTRRRWPDGNGAPSTEVGVGALGDAAFPLRYAQREGERCDDVAQFPTTERAAGERRAHAGDAEVGGGAGLGGDAAEPWAEWNGGLAGHLRLDDGLSAWLAGARIAIGGPRGTAAASLLVEAFGDAVVPQIPEAIGRAILRTEAALAAIYGRAA